MSLLGSLFGTNYPQSGGTPQPPPAPAPTAPTGQGAVAPAASGGDSGGASSTGSGPSGGTAGQPGTPQVRRRLPSADRTRLRARRKPDARPTHRHAVRRTADAPSAAASAAVPANGPSAAAPAQAPAAAAPAATAPEPADDEESARSAAIAAQAREHLASLAEQVRKPDDRQYADDLKALRGPGDGKRRALDRAA